MAWKQVQFRGYAVANITSEVKKGIKADKTSEKQLFDWVSKVTADGYKFSVSFDDENSAYQASLYCKDADSPNSGLMLSLRHIDPITAIKALRTVHVDVYAGVWMTREDFDW